MKIITLCGSLKFQKEMMIIAEKMALEGKCNNYIGNSTNSEIEYAKKLGKDILYYTDLIKNN